MTSLLFSGKRHVINNVMTTHVLTLSAGTSDVMKTMHFFIEIMSTLKAIKSSFERSYDKQDITLVAIP